MKEMIAKDSDRLLVFDDKVKHKGLFSWLLPRVLAWFLLLALTVYGLANLIL